MRNSKPSQGVLRLTADWTSRDAIISNLCVRALDYSEVVSASSGF